MFRFRLSCLLLTVLAAPLAAQVNTGDLRLKITDSAGLAPKALVVVSSEATHYHGSFLTDLSGTVDCNRLPFGSYLIQVSRPGFATTSVSVEVRSIFPIDRTIQLTIAPLSTSVQVDTAGQLIDSDSPSPAMRIGTTEIKERIASLPGRSVQDLVNTQPGWLYEGNAVLHPRGSEYQTQFVVDGIPLTDNRSPAFGPEIEADDLSSISIYTAGYPAEYGRKLGGVVELNTRRDTNTGLHGQLVLSGGSYDTAASSAEAQYLRGKNTFGISASGSMTSHYLNPVVPENYTNTGTTGDFSGRYERDFSYADRLNLTFRHELSRFLIPNEIPQQIAGQRQHGANFETMGAASYQHVFSADTLATFAGMARNNSNDLTSNALSTPILAEQHNSFQEGYFKSTLSKHYVHHELKAGIESDATFIHERFNYTITDPTQFAPDTASNLRFQDSRPDLEQAAFVQDQIHVGNWAIGAGLRYDHYQLLLNDYAFSPRLAVARYFPGPGTMVHGSLDRVFQTPSFENILISSSPRIDAVNNQFLRLPVQPSRAIYYEAGVSQAVASRARFDVNVYRRDFDNYAEDDQLLNTGVSYPTAFRRAVIYGAEGKLELVELGKLSGFVSYSYMVGNVWFPVTGGLFLSDNAAAARTQLSGHMPDSQDQRNTLRARFRYKVSKRLWFASGLSFGSGLPFDYLGNRSDAAAQYGASVANRLDFARGRVLPAVLFNATAAAELYGHNTRGVRLQVDGVNLNDQLDVIDFGGLFSGNAIGPGRSYTVRVVVNF